MIPLLFGYRNTTKRSAADARNAESASVVDQQFLDGLTRLLRSHVDFLLAKMASDEERISSTAADLIVWREDRFVTVRDLVDACSSHGWNSTIYEAWVWETANRVRELESRLDETSATALQIHARRQDLYEVDTGEMYRALDDARHALEGEPLLD